MRASRPTGHAAWTEGVKPLRRLLNTLLGVVMTPILLFEEWGWEPLRRAAAWVATSWPLAWLNRRIAKLPPYAALALMAVPSMTIIPVKIVAVWLITRGLVGWSVVLLVVSKLLGTALLAHLFSLTQPALMRISWFARGYGAWSAWKNARIG